ncbi:GNAT family N-acetyltransferase [Staphylococcus sp. GSSP0090]|nr:GNAT family N-acetyltransferase [Staphylococcus sp. GSSP0090]
MDLYIKHTKDLTSQELVQIYQERIRVFVVEQKCIYQEVDDYDQNAIHMILRNGDDIVAYTRIIAFEQYVSFGRVLVNENYRNHGYGRKIVNDTIAKINEMYQNTTIKISGQAHLKSFYESFGLHRVSGTYLEDGIPHIAFEMRTEN